MPLRKASQWTPFRFSSARERRQWRNRGACVSTGQIQKHIKTDINYIRALQNPPYSLDLVPADYSLFWRINSDLADVSITHETFKTELERVLRSIGENEFTGAFQRWLHCHEKCIALQGRSVEKSYKIKFLLSLTVFVLLNHSHLLLNTPRMFFLWSRW